VRVIDEAKELMVKCPYCGKSAMSRWQKAGLGPGRLVECQSCGRKVAAHWLAIFAAIPAFLGGLFFMKSDSMPMGLVAVVAGVLLMGLLHTFLVPLVRADA
jgi:hypothetical protein